MRKFEVVKLTRTKEILSSFSVSTILVLTLLASGMNAFGQGVGVNENGADPDPSAIMDVSSRDRGMLIPRMPKAAKLAIPAPANGLLVYQTDDTVGFWYYDQNTWVPIFQHVTAGNGLVGGKLDAYGTISLEPTGVATGTYGYADSIPQFTVNQFGQLVFAGNIPLVEQDGEIGNEITDTSGAFGMLRRGGSGNSSDPYTVGVTPGNAPNDIWMWDGNNWTLASFPFEKDSIIGNEISDTSLARGILITNGNGTSANPLTIGVTAGNALGDVFMWDGGKWVSSPIVFPVERDSVIGNEIADTINARGVLTKSGLGTELSPYRIGITPGNNVGDVFMWNGNNWVPSSISIPAEQDGEIGNEIVDTTQARGLLTTFGLGTAGSPRTIGTMPGTTNGDVWMWDGNKWVPSQITFPTVTFPKEKDSVIGNEIADTFNTYGLITRYGSGTDADPYMLGAIPGTSPGQSLVWNGAEWILTTIVIPAEQDSVIGNEISDTSGSLGMLNLSGTGTAGNPLTIGMNSGSTNGDVWMWNGNTWVPTQISFPAEVDGIIGNEITDTNSSNGMLNRFGAGTAGSPFTVGINDGSTNGDVWMWNGNSWLPTQISFPAEVDGVIGNEVTDTITNGFLALTGAGTAANPKKIGLKPGNVAGEMLIWSGSTWVPGILGKNTLDMAYDEGGAGAGREIIADNGAVEIQGTDGLIVRGTFGSGVTPGTMGAGTRMNFNPRTSSFRAGTATGTVWNTANVGIHSIAMGYNPLAKDPFTVAIGRATQASGNHSIALGDSNVTSLAYSMSIGNHNVTGGRNTTVIGTRNVSYGQFSTVIGINNNAQGTNAGIFGEESIVLPNYKHGYAFGYRDTVKGDYATAIGYNAFAEGTGAIAIGTNVRTNNPHSVAIGYNALAIADQSVAIGSHISTNNKNGSFVFGDASTTAVTLSSSLNRMTMRFDNGYRIYTKSDLSTGVYMNNGGTGWVSVSDRNMKENFESIDGEEILQKIQHLPITKWNYKGNEDNVKHIGPMAQDFHAAFKLGGSDSLGISTLEFDGVNMAAIQALTNRTDKIETLENKVSEQEAEIEALRRELEELRQLILKKK